MVFKPDLKNPFVRWYQDQLQPKQFKPSLTPNSPCKGIHIEDKYTYLYELEKNKNQSQASKRPDSSLIM